MLFRSKCRQSHRATAVGARWPPHSSPESWGGSLVQSAVGGRSRPRRPRGPLTAHRRTLTVRRPTVRLQVGSVRTHSDRAVRRHCDRRISRQAPPTAPLRRASKGHRSADAPSLTGRCRRRGDRQVLRVRMRRLSARRLLIGARLASEGHAGANAVRRRLGARRAGRLRARSWVGGEAGTDAPGRASARRVRPADVGAACLRRRPVRRGPARGLLCRVRVGRRPGSAKRLGRVDSTVRGLTPRLSPQR
jgi:hypothetical protein